MGEMGFRTVKENGKFVAANMESTRIEENVVLSRLTQAANEKGIILTVAHRVFFLRLLNLAIRTGYDEDKGLFVELTVKELSKALHTPCQTTMQSLKNLSDCGVLERVAIGKNTSSKRHGRTMKTIISEVIYK